MSPPHTYLYPAYASIAPPIDEVLQLQHALLSDYDSYAFAGLLNSVYSLAWSNNHGPWGFNGSVPKLNEHTSPLKQRAQVIEFIESLVYGGRIHKDKRQTCLYYLVWNEAACAFTVTRQAPTH